MTSIPGHCSKKSAPASTTPGGSFDVAGKEAELVELRELASAPDLWNDQDRAKEVTQKLARYEGIIENVHALESRIDDAEVLFELAAEEEDVATAAEVREEVAALDGELTLLERESLFSGDSQRARRCWRCRRPGLGGDAAADVRSLPGAHLVQG